MLSAFWLSKTSPWWWDLISSTDIFVSESRLDASRFDLRVVFTMVVAQNGLLASIQTGPFLLTLL